jgi:hypothetical protein
VKPAQRLEHKVGPAANLLAHSTRNAHSTGRALRLKPSRHVYAVTVHIATVHDHVAKVDANAESDAALGWSIAIKCGNCLLHLHGTSHRSLDTIEHHEDCVACCINDPAAILCDGRIDKVATERSEQFQRPGVIRSDQPAVGNDVGMDHSGKFPSAECPGHRWAA